MNRIAATAGQKFWLTVLFVFALMLPTTLWAKTLQGEPAPLFTLNDAEGKSYDLAKLEGTPLLILYFFDAASRTSREGIIGLDVWARKYPQADLTVWCVTRSDKSSIKELIAHTKISLPILVDSSNVSDLYNARTILPTVCIIGPHGKIINFIQGGGKSNEIMLTKLAEVQLQRKQTLVAAKMGAELVEQDPKNLKAKAILGHAQLTSGKVAAAEKTFDAISEDSDQGKQLRREGLSEVYLAKGEFDKAWDAAEKLEKAAPKSAAANISKAKVLLKKGDDAAAEKELAKGAAKEPTFAFRQSEAVNKQGRLVADLGRSKEAVALYAMAEEIDPYNIEATSNKGLMLEKEGNLDKALAAYRQVLEINQKDIYASVLAKRVEAKLTIENDLAKKKRMDALIKDLSQRFKEQKNIAAKTPQDNWTSRPLVLSFIDIKESGGLPDRDGFVLVLIDQLGEFLNTSGRMTVVDRRMLEGVISELNLGSSQLADPATALKLGKLFAAKLIVTGSVHYLPNETLLSLRLLDTETSAVAKVITTPLAPDGSLEKVLGRLNKEILATVTDKYPLKGYVADVKADQVMINIGKNQGVVLGTRFAVIQEGDAVTYKGKVLSGAPKKTAVLEVVKVEPEYSLTKIVSKESPVKQDDKITETMAEL